MTSRRVIYVLLSCIAGCRPSEKETPPLVNVVGSGQVQSVAGNDMHERTFAEAELLLGKSGQQLAAVPTATARPPRWVNPEGVGFREYRTLPETHVQVFVYAFSTENDATAAEPAIRLTLLDGSRAHLVRRGRTVFWAEAPIQLPGRPFPATTSETFDAIVAALAGS